MQAISANVEPGKSERNPLTESSSLEDVAVGIVGHLV